MSSTHTIERPAGPPPRVGPPTRPERTALLRALLLGRGLERALPRLTDSGGRATDPAAVLTAIAAASALDPEDRLITPHNFLCAHLVHGADPTAVARARLGRRSEATSGLLAGVGPQSPIAFAVGVALAIRRAATRRCAVALLERRWAETEECRSALALAGEQGLPLVLVAIDSDALAGPSASAVDRDDFEAVRAAVRASIDAAHDDRGAALVVSSAVAEADSHRPRSLFRNEAVDPLVAYERRLLINGFSRADLTAVHNESALELERAIAAASEAGGEE